MKIIFLSFFIGISLALYTQKDGCCLQGQTGEICKCTTVFTCDVNPVFNNETEYMPMCVEKVCQENCYFSDWMITLIATVGVFFIDLFIVLIIWLICRTRT